MNRRYFFLFVLVIALIFSGIYAFGERLALIGGTVIDVSSFGYSQSDIKDAVVIIEGGKINVLGRKGEIRIPENTRVIDVKGKYILPGLIDGFAALDNQAYANAYLYMGVTSIVGIYGYRRAPLFENANPSPHIYRFAGIGSSKTETEKILQEMDNLAEQGVKVLLLHYELTPSQVKQAVEKAHKLGMVTIGELGKTSYPDAIKFGVDAFVHFSRYSVELADPEMKARVAEQPFGPPSRMFRRWLASLDPRDGRVLEYAKLLGSSGAALMPTFSLYCVELPGLDNPWKEPVAKILKPEDIHFPLDKSTGKHGFEAEIREAFIKEAENALRIQSQYYKAGARHLAGSGTDVFGTMPGISLHQELELLTKVGLSEREAIASATGNFAAVFGWKETGQIKPGCRADIVVTEKNPIDNIKNLKSISLVIQGGKIIDREKLLEPTCLLISTKTVENNIGR